MYHIYLALFKTVTRHVIVIRHRRVTARIVYTRLGMVIPSRRLDIALRASFLLDFCDERRDSFAFDSWKVECFIAATAPAKK